MDANYNMSRQLCYYFYFGTLRQAQGALRVQLRVQIRDRARHDLRLFFYYLDSTYHNIVCFNA